MRRQFRRRLKGQLAILFCAALTSVSAKSIRANSDPSQAAAICAAQGSDSTLVAHEDCHKFYKCFEGRPVAIDCPFNLVYNPDKEYCDWPANYQCKAGNTQEEVRESESDSAADLCSAPGSESSLLPHENCHKFYECAGGVPVAFDCPEDLVFNPAKKLCDYAANVQCQAKTAPVVNIINEFKASDVITLTETGKVVSRANDDPSKAPEICAAEGSDSTLVAHEECNKFYECSKGHPVALKCPLNLLYNPEKEYCDWSGNVDCGDRIKP